MLKDSRRIMGRWGHRGANPLHITGFQGITLASQKDAPNVRPYTFLPGQMDFCPGCKE